MGKVSPIWGLSLIDQGMARATALTSSIAVGGALVARRADMDPEQELWPGAAPTHVRIAPSPASGARVFAIDDEATANNRVARDEAARFVDDIDDDSASIDETDVRGNEPSSPTRTSVRPDAATATHRRSRLARLFGLGYLVDPSTDGGGPAAASTPSRAVAAGASAPDTAEIPSVPMVAVVAADNRKPSKPHGRSRAGSAPAPQVESTVDEAVALPEPIVPSKPLTAAAKLDAIQIDTNEEIETLRAQVRNFYLEVKKEAKRLAREREVFDTQHAAFVDEQTALRLLHAEVAGAREALDTERAEFEHERVALFQISERVSAMNDDVQRARDAVVAEQEQAWQQIDAARAQAAATMERAETAVVQAEATARDIAGRLDADRAVFETEVTTRNGQLVAQRTVLDEQAVALAAETRGIAAERESLVRGRADLERAQREAEEVLGRKAEVEDRLAAVERAAAENAALRERLDAERIELEVERGELDRVRVEIEASKQRVDALEARLVEETRRRAEAEEARRVLDDARTRYRDLEGVMRTADSQFASLLDRRWEAWMATRPGSAGAAGPAVSEDHPKR